MVTACDTSFLFSLYGSDAHSAKAVAWIAANTTALHLNALTQFEFGNALRFAEFRKVIPPQSAARSWAVQVAPAGPDLAPAYDANGNCDADGVRHYEWDAADRLSVITEDARPDRRTEIAYGPNGLRSRVTERDGSQILSDTALLWDGLELAEERDLLADPSGATPGWHLLPQGERRLSGPAPGSYFYTRDHLGSVREMTDSAGIVRARYGYDAWGVRVRLGGDLDTDAAYTGHTLLPCGLLLALFRAYDPATARWLSRDPIAEQGGVNLYAYVGNNVLSLNDAFGLRPDLNMFPNGFFGIGREPIRKNSPQLPDYKQTYTAGGHGNPQSLAGLNAKELAEKIRKDPNFKDAKIVVLYSCETGQGKNSLAEQLSKELEITVVAPNEIIWIGPGGDSMIYPAIDMKEVPLRPNLNKPGRWITFPYPSRK